MQARRSEEPITLSPPELPKLIDRLDALPSIPLVAERIGRLVHDPRSDARAIAQVMRGDPALTAKVLKLVNAPYFAIPGGVSDIERAIPFLGFNTIYQLVLTCSVFEVLGVRSNLDAQRLFRHSLAAAGSAQAIAELIGHPDPPACFTAGLLHDVGRFAVLRIAPDLFTQSLELAEREDLPLVSAEANLGFLSHDAIGLRLAKRWRFPLALQLAIGHHHRPTARERVAVPGHLHGTIDVVALADAICPRWGYGTHAADTQPLPAEPLERLNLTEAFEQEANDRLRRQIERSSLLMDALGGS